MIWPRCGICAWTWWGEKVERRWKESRQPALLTAFAQDALAAAEASPAPSAAEVASDAARTPLEAAEAGYPKAQMRLAQLYRQGVGVPCDPLAASVWPPTGSPSR